MSQDRKPQEAENLEAKTNGADQTDEAAQEAENEAAQSDAAAVGGDEVGQLRAQLEQAQEESAEHKDRWLRSAAELQNYKRRSEQRFAETITTANARLITQILPVLDDFELAFQSLPEDLRDSEQSWVEGFRMVYRKLVTILEQEGVTPIPTDNERFDPNLHEAVTYEMHDDFEEGMIIAEVRRGYRLGDRVLRPALARVAQ